MPLGGTLAFLLAPDQLTWLHRERGRLIEELRRIAAAEGFPRLEAWRAGLPDCPLPLMMALRFENFLSADALARNLLPLGEGPR